MTIPDDTSAAALDEALRVLGETDPDVLDAALRAAADDDDEGVAFPTNLDPLDLTCLTHGERLFLWRRAQRAPVGGTLGRDGAGLSRAEAAAAIGATPEDWDRCEVGAVPNRRLLKLLGDQPPPAVGELCRIARRRSGVPLAEIETALGVARPTLHRMERVGYPRLIAYWQERGYRFP